MSYYTSLSGLDAAQTNLSVTSNNIANVGTTGFKKARANFGDIVAGSLYQVQDAPGLGTSLQGIGQQFTQGDFAATENTLNMAISGQGFFVTRNGGGTGATTLTRAGDFSTDANGNVTDDTGGYLQVLPVDAQGNATGAGLGALRNLQIAPTNGTSAATGKLDQSVTLPASADLPASRAAFAGGGYAFAPSDPNSYNYSTSTTVYDSAGDALQATTYYVRTKAPTASDPTSTWDAHLFVGDAEASAGGTATPPATPLTLTFDATGALTAPAGATDFAAASPTGASAPLALTVDYGSTTKQASTGFALTGTSQDGTAAGKFSGLAIGADGLVSASYSDGSSKTLGRVAIANVNNAQGLRAVGDSKWAITADSGDATVGGADSNGLGSVKSGYLEGSNVDVTAELVQLIQAQRDFQANAKAIDTSSQITETAINLHS